MFRKLHEMKPALSAFVVFLSTDLDMRELGAKHEMFFYDSWDHEKTYANMMKGDVSSSDSSFGVNVPDPRRSFHCSKGATHNVDHHPRPLSHWSLVERREITVCG